MTVADPVRLLVNGLEFAGWLAVRITAGLDRQARDFEVAVTERWPGSLAAPRRIRPGDAVQVLIGPDLVVTGYVDATPVAYDAARVSVAVKGRSRTADLVDCAALDTPGQWQNRKVEDIAAALARPYDVAVRCLAETGPVVPDHQVQQGESAYESLERLLKLRALLSTDDAEGCLVLTRAGSERAGGALVVGETVLTGAAELDTRDRFATYVCKGQRAGNDDDFGAAVAQAEGRITDGSIRPRRRLVLTADSHADDATCRRRVQWEAAHRAGQTWRTVYTVAGWRQADGRLWQPNTLVRVRDPIIGLDCDMLIGEVTWSLDEAGSVTTLMVAPAAAWELSPVVKTAKGQDAAAIRPGETLVRFD